MGSPLRLLDVVTVNTIVQSEEDAEACFHKNRMRSFESNMIARDVSDGLHKAVRG
jgi:hypothetical protein